MQCSGLQQNNPNNLKQKLEAAWRKTAASQDVRMKGLSVWISFLSAQQFA